MSAALIRPTVTDRRYNSNGIALEKCITGCLVAGEITEVEASFIAVVHKLEDATLALRIEFSICLIAVFFAGLYVLRRRHELFGRDPHVITDSWAARNLRLWQVLLVWILTMELLITMLFRL